MKKSIILSTLLIATLAFFSSFVGYDTVGDAPGNLQFIGNAGGENLFTFQKWQFTNVELPDDNFEKIKATVEINASSFTCDWKDLETNVKKKKDYFFVKKFPSVNVVIDGAQMQEDSSYTTDASLTLKGVTKIVPLTFTVSETVPYQVKGNGVIMRSEFKFNGDGPNEEVPVKFDFTLPAE
ncbi:MAG: polyisoprenoid-binding protein YceI [Saprospiraceae bacterium]|jgi:polyisoprenoid-binding protein YceI